MTPNIESLESVVSQTAEVETNAESVEQLEISEAPAPITPQKAPNKEPVPWGTFLRKATTEAIKERLCSEITEILKAHGLEDDCCLAILEPQNSIDSFDLDQIFTALKETNPHNSKRVILFVISAGGSIEPAYQISKLCKSFALGQFIVVVARHAKSAATMVAIGADEIHMGPLGQLGPIDPQIGGLPALGVSQALKTIASVAQRYPGSAEMFAKYLRMSLTVEQIGYCDRISESAVQYAQRLLSTKPGLVAIAPRIAKELVYEYKDHGFVIDLDEAKKHLGENWIKTGTPELQAGEHIYTLLELVNLYLKASQSKRVLISGCPNQLSSIVILDIEPD
jgi:Serine dehydrogenase proteinase